MTAKGSKSPLYKVCGSESQERSRDQSQGIGQEAESCGGGGEEEENDGVPPATPGQVLWNTLTLTFFFFFLSIFLDFF